MSDPGLGSGEAPWVIVAPGFHRRGGMERANLALAEHLLSRGAEVHLVAHSIDERLAGTPGVHAHLVARPVASFLLAEGLLNRRGRAVAAEVVSRSPLARVVVNGGNCDWGDVNWVHYVHHAWYPTSPEAPLWFRLKARLLSARARRDERRVIPTARLVVSNSRATTAHLVELLGVPASRVKTVYLGTEPGWSPPSPGERSAARDWLGVEPGVPLVVFVGALGYDSRKGFDTLLEAWARLVRTHGWTGRLVAAGGGRGLEMWRSRVGRLGLDASVKLLGFTDRVVDVLAAADLLVSPVRYEAYGLNVHEALCRGVPAIVSRAAGIAERFPPELEPLLLDDPESVTELVARMGRWKEEADAWRARVAPVGRELRARTWDAVAGEIVAAAGRASP